MIEKLRAVALVGTASQVSEKLQVWTAILALDEIVINTWIFDAQARRHSYSLLADAFGLISMAVKAP